MSATTIISSAVEQFLVSNKPVLYFVGAPGCAKTSVAKEIAIETLKRMGVENPEDHILIVNPSLMEPVDIAGLPSLEGDYVVWKPQYNFWKIRKGTGPCFLIVDELPDAEMAVQNVMCRVLLDRVAGNLELSEELCIIATGNRTEDRSGANRLSTKLANRMRSFDFKININDWSTWAQKHGIDSMLIAFLNFRPEFLCTFDPKLTVNATPRSWEDVSRIPVSFAPDVYQMHVAGCVGDGPAAEYCAFRAIVDRLPDIKEIEKHPDTAPIPTESDVLYALMAKIADMVVGDGEKDAGSAKRLDSLWKYIKRVPTAEFAIMCLKIIVTRSKTCIKAKCFSEIVKNYKVLVNV